MAKISNEAKAEIERRKADARPRMLSELALVVAARAGVISEEQIGLVAGLLARTEPVMVLRQRLTDWLARHCVSGAAVERYFAGPEWTALLTQAVEAATGEDDLRPDVTIDECRTCFKIEDDEAERLGLTTLVGERLRSKLRRSAEGSSGRRGRPKREDRPWEELGIPERTWRDRQMRQKKAEQKALVDRAENDSQIRRKFDPIDQTLDPAILFNNRVEFPANMSADLTFYDAWEDLPQQPLPASASDAIPAWVRQTAEARRLAALAQRLGMVFSGHPDHHPRDWWQTPPGVVLSDSDAASFEEAVLAVCRAEQRQEYIAEARRNAAACARRVSRSNPVPPVPAPTSAEGEAKRPPLVSEQIWDAVPDDLRAEARRYAALHYAAGELPDRAMVMGVEQARRTRALVEAVIALRAEFAGENIAKLADESRDLWKLATSEAVLALIAQIEAKQAMGAQRNTEMSQAVRREFLRRVRLEAHSNQLFHGDREAIVAEAARRIDQEQGLSNGDPYRVVLDIWRALEKARKG